MTFSGFLREVIEKKQADIAKSQARIPLSAIREEAEVMPPPPADFLTAVAAGTADAVGIIAEIKKASPSKGDIRPGLDVAEYVRKYTKAGARAISVLTEPHFFSGSLQDLERACRSTELPVLRKDFTISSYQIYEAKQAGASSILLITTLLSRDQMADYIRLARDLGLEPLVEINCEKELETACYCEASVIGINNRNLQTLETDKNVSRRIASLIPGHIDKVAASGINTRQDIDAGVAAGFHSFLVGESIVRAEDPVSFIRTLIFSAPRHSDLTDQAGGTDQVRTDHNPESGSGR